MTDDRIVKDTARDPEREALGSVRGGLRAAAKKAVRKVARKAGRKKAATKAAAGAGKTAARGAASAKKSDRTARTAAAPASGAAATRVSAASAGTAAAGAAAAHSPKAGTAGPEAVPEGVADASATPARESGSSIDRPRPPGPMHPGAVMESMQEQSGGLGGLLALWGPLIIVGFLVLVFRGGDDPETAVATAADATEPAPIDAPAVTARAAAPPVTARGAAETFEGGFAMRTSMAGPPALAGPGAVSGGSAVAPGTLYPSPPGPYRDPRYRRLPTGESWSTTGAGEWVWSAEVRADSRQADGGDAPVRWVRCAAPYYWCPAPSSPAW